MNLKVYLNCMYKQNCINLFTMCYSVQFLAITKQHLEIQNNSAASTIKKERTAMLKHEIKLFWAASLMIGYCIITWIPLEIYFIISSNCNCQISKYVR